MAYIIDNLDLIKKNLGNISTFQIMMKEFSSKVHLADFGNGFECNIPEIDLLTKYYKQNNPNIGISIGFIVLDRGLMICFHYNAKICYLGIENKDIIGWKLLNSHGDWIFLFFTKTNQEKNLLPIRFFVKNQNLPKVREYFVKYGFKEI